MSKWLLFITRQGSKYLVDITNDLITRQTVEKYPGKLRDMDTRFVPIEVMDEPTVGYYGMVKFAYGEKRCMTTSVVDKVSYPAKKPQWAKGRDVMSQPKESNEDNQESLVS